MLVLSLWAYHFTIADRSVVSFFYYLISGVAASVLSVICSPTQVSAGHTRSTINSLLVKLLESGISAHLHSFVPLFFPTCGINFHILFNLMLPSMSSKQLITTISDHHHSKTMIFSVLVNSPVFAP